MKNSEVAQLDQSAASTPTARATFVCGAASDAARASEFRETRNISASQLLFAAQLRQLKHDERYHRDITLLRVGERMKHMALHMAKYSARFLGCGDHADVIFRTALVDAFIISLASANTLNVDIGARLDSTGCATLGGLEDSVMRRRANDPKDEIWFARHFAKAMGSMAKAAESLDHMEAFPFREAMTESILEMVSLVIGEAAGRQIDLLRETDIRLDGVERRSILQRAADIDAPR